jgi:predicted permease
MLRDVQQDLRYGLRMMRRRPGFAALVVATLALGIGANAAIFSLVDAVLLRKLPVREPERLVLFEDGSNDGLSRWDEVTERRLDLYTYPLYRLLREDRSFAGIAAQDSTSNPAVVAWPAAGVATEGRASGRAVSASYFSVLGVRAAHGRTFLPEDETAPGANPVLVLSQRFWQRRFGGDPGVVGMRLTVNGAPFTVVGVTAPGFAGAEIGGHDDFWVPLTMIVQLARKPGYLSLLGPPRSARDLRWLHLVGRLAPGVPLAAAEGSVDRAFQSFLDADPALARTVRARQPVHVALAPGARGFPVLADAFGDELLALLAGVGLLLLIVSLNVSHLLLARVMTRQHEMGLRTALGASRGRLVQQLLTEGLLLSALGATGGLLMSRWACDALTSLANVSDLEVTVNGQVLAFTTSLALGIAVVIGLVPALFGHGHRRGGRGPGALQQALRADARAIAGHGGGRRLVSRLLLASQVAFSLVLLVGAGLLAGTLGRLRAVDKGFDADGVLLVELDEKSSGLRGEALLSVYDTLLRRVAALPSVRSASLSHAARLPRGGRWVEPIFVAGSATELRTVLGTVTPDHFDTLGLTVVAGRGFSGEDRRGAPPVAVVNATLARKLAPAVDPAGAVGKRFRLDANEILVVGIVRDARTNGLRQAPRPMAYFPVAQVPRALEDLEVRAAPGADLSLLPDQIRRVVREVHPGLSVAGSRTLSGYVERSLRQERLVATLSGAFGLAALFLVSLGLFGVISQWVAQRTREIGVRLALGSTTGGVRWLVFRQALAVVLLGVLAGIPAAVVAAGLLEGLLFGVQPTDARTLVASACALFVVALAAAYLPARRASRLDPMAALRAE